MKDIQNRSEYQKEYRIRNKVKAVAYSKEYRLKNRGILLEAKRKYHHEHREEIAKKDKIRRQRDSVKIAEKQKEYYQRNKEVIYKKTRAYIQKNRESVRMYMRNYKRNRRNEDIQFRLAETIRCRLGRAITNDSKTGSAVRDLGCTISELKFYIEGKFQDGMSWDNWTLYGWHIDHEIPLSFFDLTNREQFLKAVHYTNLQPMWWRENLSKGAKISESLSSEIAACVGRKTK